MPAPPRPLREVVTDAVLDLVLGSHCLGCESPGRLVCSTCALDLDVQPAPCWPTPTPDGLVEPWAATSYDALARDLVLGLKERGLLSLSGPLAGLLAAAVTAALDGQRAGGGGVVLVPVPSRSATVRARGHDAIAATTRRAASRLRAAGLPVTAVPLLRLRAGVADQSGLDAGARRRNLDGSMTCPTPALRRMWHRHGAVRAVICDDVVTTGSTLREAQRALEAVGVPVCAAAVVAATRLRGPPPPPADSR